MSIPDNPFSSTDTSPQTDHVPSTSSAPPRRTDTAASASPTLLAPVPVRQDSSRLETTTPSPARTPGGSLLQQPGAARSDRPPRHVQFNNQSHVVSLAPLRPEAPGTPEHTLSSSNLDQVDTALERHRTTQRRRPPRELTVSTDSSADGLTDGEDYDYRLDVEPPGTTHPGPQSPVSGDGPNSEGRALQNLLGIPGDTWVPREYIPLGETDGLPSQIPGQEAQDERNEAKDLVRAHTGRWGTLRRRVKNARTVNRAFEGEGRHHHFSRHHEDSAEGGHAGDPEKSPVGRIRSPQGETGPSFADGMEEAPGLPRRQSGGLPPLPGGGGTSVLSSLLQLYNQSNIPQSGATSATSSRASSEDEYSSDDSHLPKKPHEEGLAPPTEDINRIISPDHGEEGIIRQPLETVAADEIQPEIPGGQPAPPPNTSSSSYVGRNSGQSTPSGGGLFGYFLKAKHEVLEKIEDADRPEAARSGAGVFGALLQSTANVSGVATPAASALAPAARRSGFQLNRFSIPESDAPLVAPRHWRPTSNSSSKNNSRPTSVHSSTAVSNTNSLDEKSRTRSNSDPLQNTDTGKLATKKPKPFEAHSLGKLPGAAIIGQGGAALKTAEKWIASKTPLTTPPSEFFGEYMGRPLTEEERRRKEWEREYRKKKKAKKARKKQEVFIIQHVAAVLARQQFLLKLARALMMFGSPSHRLETQIQATARVLELNAQVVYLPGVMLIAFNDDATHTSETKFLKQSTGIDLGKLLATHNIYWDVIHDRCSVDEASKCLDVLMTSRSFYNWWQTVIIGATCSAFISVISYHGSFIDALISMPLGALLIVVQMLSVKNDLFSNVFEIAIATLISFLSAALASTGKFCYTALVSGGVVLILPGYIVLTGALELASRNIISGSVRIGYSVIYSLFLGFGISIGAEFWIKFTGQSIKGTAQYDCSDAHTNAPWYQVTPSPYWWFLCCPGFAIALALRNQQPILVKELPVMTLIAAAGWCSNHFTASAFPNRADMTSAIGAFVVGTLGNIYGRFSHGASFPVTVIGILFQLPSGLANGGIFNFAQESTSGSGNAYSDGFQVAEQLVSVAIGLTVGLFVSAVVTNPLGGGRRTGSGIFAF